MLILGSDILANRYMADLETLENNSWNIIKEICEVNAIPDAWLYQTKSFVGTDGYTYHLRLSDKQAGRYTFEDGSPTHAVFEMVELFPTTYMMNMGQTNAGGFGASAMFTTLNDTLIDILPNEIKDILKITKVKAANGGGSNYSAIVDVNCKLFLPAALEVGLNTQYGKAGEGTKWDYYSTYTSNNDRRKAAVTTPTSYIYYWLRSPEPNRTTHFSGVYSSGAGSSDASAYLHGVCACFAL